VSTLEAPPRTYQSRGGAALAPMPEPRVAPAPRRAPEPRPNHLRVVAPSEKARRRLSPATGVVLTGLMFATLFAIAIAHALLVQAQVKLDGLDSKLSVEQARYHVLRERVAEMESPPRVVAAAQQLGMVAPDDLVYLQPEVSQPAPSPQPTVPPGAGTATQTNGAGDADLATDAGSDWSMMKPLLEAPAP
jgi:cell division protein FtsL